ncbi:MAG TPA: hypothetical protein VFA03_17000 [Acetobacteraceae bacterium]|nr:hypothetical protein [Acetobacteraceae bacterium]
MRQLARAILLSGLLAGCAAPIGRDGEPVGLGQALCESFPGTTCCLRHRVPPLPQPYCTATLGVPDCWIDPALLPNRPPDLQDQPPPAPGGCS